MSHYFSGKSIIPGQDPDVSLLEELPPFANSMGKANTDAHDCRMPERVKIPGQGRRPDKILSSLKDRNWFCRNQTVGKVDNGYIVKGGVLTASEMPVLGVSQLFWEKKYADPEKQRIPKLGKADNLKGSFSVLPFSISARYDNFFHFMTEYLSLVPALDEKRKETDYSRIIITTPKPETGSFHHGLLSSWFEEDYDNLIFEPGIFRADSIIFPIDRCDYYSKISDAESIQSKMPADEWRGMAGVLSTGLQRIYNHLSSRASYRDDTPSILIISRARAGRRQLVNEDALAESLSDLGARQIILENYSVSQQIELVSNAKVLIGCHGAGMINAGFMREGSLAIELTSRQYLPRADDFAGQAALRDISYHVFLCDENGSFNKDSKLEVNVGNDILLTEASIKTVSEVCRRHMAGVSKE